MIPTAGVVLNLDQIVQGCPATELLYLREMDLQAGRAKVTRVVPDKSNHFYLVLDKSIFHPKGGGQPSDTGKLSGENFQVNVKKVIDHGGVLVYWVKVLTGTPVLGEVRCEVDFENRRLFSRRHSAAHLLDHCLSTITKGAVQTTDSWLGEDSYVGYKGKLPDPELLKDVESMAKQMISNGAQITIKFLNRNEADELKNAPNFERLPHLSELRIVTITGCGPIPCGGTHVSDISLIGELSLQKSLQIDDNGYRLYFAIS